jgi:hypothetical protein
MDLPEQDLRLPILIPERGWLLGGFSRLEHVTPEKTMAFSEKTAGNLWILTNYRTEHLPDPGTPVFRAHFRSAVGDQDFEVILRAGEETAGWEGPCSSCVSVYEWTKSLHLLGSFSYPGAYRQYRAHVWGFSLGFDSEPFDSVTVEYLLAEGTGYFWGIFPDD